jgi:hypothetical protein
MVISLGTMPLRSFFKPTVSEIDSKRMTNKGSLFFRALAADLGPIKLDWFDRTRVT